MTENVEQQEVETTEAAPVEESKESAPTSTETPNVEEKESKAEVEDEPKLTQKQVDEAIQKRLARESRKLERQIRAEVENEYLRNQIQSQSRQQVTEQPSGEPKPEQFKTYEEYLDKLTDYKLEKRMAQVLESTEQQRQYDSQAQYESKIAENLLKGEDKYDDYHDVVDSIPDRAVTIVMRDAIGESEVGADIAYYLGLHPKEAADIAKLSNVAQVKAIDRLEAKLKAPPKVSDAPAPANVVGKGKATQQVDLNSASLDDYMKIRQKQGARWANR